MQIPSFNLRDASVVNCIKVTNTYSYIAFNYNNAIMGAGNGETIELWSFNNGEMTKIQQLFSDYPFVKYFTFSKRSNILITGSGDNIIQIRREKAGIWKIIAELRLAIRANIMNAQLDDFSSSFHFAKKDTQIIICGYATTVFRKLSSTNQWRRNQILSNDNVYYLDLNSTQTQLAAATTKKKRMKNRVFIIIWELYSEDLWKKKQSLSMNFLPQVRYYNNYFLPQVRYYNNYLITQWTYSNL